MEMNKLNPLFSLWSRRQHKAWGVSPRNHATESTKPVKWATAVSDSLLMTANASPLSPASRARVPGGVYPGAKRPRLYAFARLRGLVVRYSVARE